MLRLIRVLALISSLTLSFVLATLSPACFRFLQLAILAPLLLIRRLGLLHPALRLFSHRAVRAAHVGVDFGKQPLSRNAPVVRLRAGGLAFHKLSTRHVPEEDGRGGFVHLLTARAGTPDELLLQVGLVQRQRR